ncbi:MAG: ribonuclease HII [Chloroflexi bacterium]|nr:ribonuclease HII [Chloroflexota bacterium]
MSQQPNLSLESQLWSQGRVRVAGIDEAGRGAWAGPVVAAVVVLPPFLPDLAALLEPVRDSKLLTPQARDKCYDLVIERALDYGVGSTPATEIDRIGIATATRLAMCQAIAALKQPPDYLLLDYVTLPLAIPQHAMPKGDLYCLSIAAASIIAKVTRDRWMIELDKTFPGYGLAQHKGYGTAQHQAALRALGPTAEHRHSFAPIRCLDEHTHADA